MENVSEYLVVRITQTTKDSLVRAARKLRRRPSELARMAIEDLLIGEGFATYSDGESNSNGQIIEHEK